MVVVSRLQIRTTAVALLLAAAYFGLRAYWPEKLKETDSFVMSDSCSDCPDCSPQTTVVGYMKLANLGDDQFVTVEVEFPDARCQAIVELESPSLAISPAEPQNLTNGRDARWVVRAEQVGSKTFLVNVNGTKAISGTIDFQPSRKDVQLTWSSLLGAIALFFLQWRPLEPFWSRQLKRLGMRVES